MAALRKLIRGLRTHAIDGGVLERFTPLSNGARVSLTASFSILDGLCDCAHFIPELSDDCLSVARGIADFWLLHQGATGLFPLYPGESESFIDSETDMSIALHKLTEVTGEPRYAAAAERCIDGLIRFHGSADYCLSVNVETGEVLNAGQRTKFVCLFLKVLILRIETSAGGTIFGNATLYELLKDR
jgi:predicted deacylase